MFLRANRRTKDGKDHTYWSLVETVRPPEGPRQRTLCYLGELNHSAQARWLKTIEVFNQQGECRQLKLFPSEVQPPQDEADVVRVLVKNVRLERTRQFGACFVGLQLWKQLELDRFFEARLDQEPAEVAWSKVAALMAINRLCAPGSELAIEQRWYPSTAVEDLLSIAVGKINDSRLYRCLDRLLPHKTTLEQHLKQRYGALFQARFDVLLYDLTSSYVEGVAEHNPLLRHGYSRDHRGDCRQVVIALIVNEEGLPLSYETFNGNRADVTTLESVMRRVERKYGKARRVWVFDRGIVSEDNLAALRQRDGQYWVGTPRGKLKEVETALLEGGWQPICPEVEVKLITTPAGQETYVLCRSRARQEKEKAIRSRFCQRMEKALGNLARRVEKGQMKDRPKIERCLGALLARHPFVADLYQISVSEQNGTWRVEWTMLEDRKAWREAREGAYLLRTNLQADSAEQLWRKYIQLTEAEAAFRTLKSELLIRPLFHQLERRIKAHILVAFLGYALGVTLKHLLEGKSSQLSPAKALALLSTLHSADIILPTTDGREIRLRRITTPTSEQKRLLDQLGMSLPKHLNFDIECSVDSAIA
jgi:transposase